MKEKKQNMKSSNKALQRVTDREYSSAVQTPGTPSTVYLGHIRLSVRWNIHVLTPIHAAVDRL